MPRESGTRHVCLNVRGAWLAMQVSPRARGPELFRASPMEPEPHFEEHGAASGRRAVSDEDVFAPGEQLLQLFLGDCGLGGNVQGTFRDHGTGLLSMIAVLNGTYTRHNRHTREAIIASEVEGPQVGQAPD